MAILNLTNQSTERNAIALKLNRMKTLLDQRLPVWEKLPIQKKVKWVKSGKDPVMTLAWTIYKYLRNNFFGETDNG